MTNVVGMKLGFAAAATPSPQCAVAQTREATTLTVSLRELFFSSWGYEPPPLALFLPLLQWLLKRNHSRDVSPVVIGTQTE